MSAPGQFQGSGIPSRATQIYTLHKGFRRGEGLVTPKVEGSLCPNGAPSLVSDRREQEQRELGGTLARQVLNDGKVPPCRGHVKRGLTSKRGTGSEHLTGVGRGLGRLSVGRDGGTEGRLGEATGPVCLVMSLVMDLQVSAVFRWFTNHGIGGALCLTSFGELKRS